MIKQVELINKVKIQSELDDNIIATLMYGSFTQNSGDKYSDVEFYIFIKDDLFKDFDSKKWISNIHQYCTYFTNEFGTEVAIFKNLVRGEFHFLRESEIDIVKSFKLVGYFPNVDSMLIYDSNGKLKESLNELRDCRENRFSKDTIEYTINGFINNLLFGINVLKRGEIARSLEVLYFVQKYLLQLIRLYENTTDHWINPTKNLENEITKETYQRYKLCCSNLSKQNLFKAYNNSILLSKDIILNLKDYTDIDIFINLIEDIDQYLQ